MSASVLAIVQLILGLFGQIEPLIAQAVQASQSNDQAQLDAILAQLQAANDALVKP